MAKSLGKNVFPAPKRGKRRNLVKKPASKKSKAYRKIPYVRHGKQTERERKDRATWARTLPQLLKATHKQITLMLKKDQLLPEWKGRCCPICEEGVMGPLVWITRLSAWKHRCNKKGCQRYINAWYDHPIFTDGHGAQLTSLQEQSSILLCSLCPTTQAATHVLTGKNHKTIEGIYRRQDEARTTYVEKKQPFIKFGNCKDYHDVEADEVDLAKCEPEDSSRSKPVEWEQWGGIIERGAPYTLVLERLNPARTKRRAPGPGPIRKRDWEPLANKYLAGRKINLNTDGARSYKLKIKGMLHTWVIHKKKKMRVAGKMAWVRPKYVKLYTHKLPEGGRLTVKGGTQIIDRFWETLRAHLGRRPRKPNSWALRRRIRSAQWVHWQQGKDLWLQTGDMAQFLFNQKHKMAK